MSRPGDWDQDPGYEARARQAIGPDKPQADIFAKVDDPAARGVPAGRVTRSDALLPRARRRDRARRSAFRGRQVVMLGSNNYLGLTTDPRVRAAAIAAVERYGTGVTGSRLLNGTLTIHRRARGTAGRLGRAGGGPGVHDRVRGQPGSARCPGRSGTTPPSSIRPPMPAWWTAPASPRGPSGPSVTTGPTACVGPCGRGGSSPTPAGRWSPWTASIPWRGTGPRWPRSPRSARTSGPGCSSTRRTPWAWSGPRGAGTAAASGVQPDLIMGTFSKSLASCGGFIAGPRPVIDYLKVTCRPLMFTASGVPAALAAALEAARIAQAEDWRREAVAARAEQLRAGLAQLGYRVAATGCAEPHRGGASGRQLGGRAAVEGAARPRRLHQLRHPSGGAPGRPAGLGDGHPHRGRHRAGPRQGFEAARAQRQSAGRW